MARGRAKSNGTTGDTKPLTKREAVRRTLETLGDDAKPAEMQGHLREHYGLEMNTNMISSYKSQLTGGTGRRGKKRGRPAKATATVAAPRAMPAQAGEVPWRDIRAIKDIAGRLGVKGLRELVEYLS
jgi:hypothetical protein